MSFRFATAILAVSAVVGSALAQTATAPTLTIGDKAPAFKPAGWVKGDEVKSFKKGEVYVVEFWATWCGPCIASMPHLSEMAESFKGKATFISVNTWDYAKTKEGAESSDTHVKRVNDWVKTNTEKMRYNICLDDAKDTISTTWMRAAGRNGIPCAFIINEEGMIAWIGHPMDKMDEVVASVKAKTWDLQAYKSKFESDAKAAAANAAVAAAKQKELQTKIDAAITAKDLDALEATFKDASPLTVISMASAKDPAFAMSAVEKFAGKVDKVAAYSWCSLAANISNSKTADQSVKDRAVKVSEMCFKDVPEGMAAVGAIYHARCLYGAGKKDDAIAWADKALGLVDKYMPEANRASLRDFINTQKDTFK